MSDWTQHPWIIFAVVLLLLMVLAVRGQNVLRVYAAAPVGVGMPAFMLLLFLVTPQVADMMVGTVGGLDGAGRYNEDLWHQLGVPAAVFLLGLQAWYWTRAALNARAGRYDDSVRRPLPAGEAWAIRFILAATAALGVVPALQASGFHLTWSGVPWFGAGASVVFTFVLWIVIRLNRRRGPRRAHQPPPRSLTLRLFAGAPWGPWPACLLMGAAFAGMGVAEFAGSFVTRSLHTPTAALLGAACYVAVAMLWLTVLQDLCAWSLNSVRLLLDRVLPRPGRLSRDRAPISAAAVTVLAMLLFITTPFAGSALGELTGMYDVPTMAGGGRPDGNDVAGECEGTNRLADGTTPVIVAMEGGASRSAAWSLSVMRTLDRMTDGAFSRNLFAFSGVSGGSLAAVTYTLVQMLPDDQAARTDKLLEAAVGLARGDLLAASAARMFSVDLLTGLPTRGAALMEAFDDYWTSLGLKPERGVLGRMQGKCLPHLILNGVDVQTGGRLMTSSVRFADSDPLAPFAGAIDVQRSMTAELTASGAVLNSARFPVSSPPGYGSGTPYRIIDGGTYEVSGIATALELAAMLKFDVKPVLLVISNDGTPWNEGGVVICRNSVTPDARTAPASGMTEVLERNQRLAKANGQFRVPEIATSLAGIVATRGTRVLAEQARARSTFCDGKNAGVTPRVFVFELPKPRTDAGGKVIQPDVPLNWVMTARDCRYMLGTAYEWSPNMATLNRLANLLNSGHEEVEATRQRLNRFQADADECGPPRPEGGRLAAAAAH